MSHFPFKLLAYEKVLMKPIPSLLPRSPGPLFLGPSVGLGEQAPMQNSTMPIQCQLSITPDFPHLSLVDLMEAVVITTLFHVPHSHCRRSC